MCVDPRSVRHWHTEQCKGSLFLLCTTTPAYSSLMYRPITHTLSVTSLGSHSALKGVKYCCKGVWSVECDAHKQQCVSAAQS